MKDFIGCNLEFAMFFISVICWLECNYSIPLNKQNLFANNFVWNHQIRSQHENFIR